MSGATTKTLEPSAEGRAVRSAPTKPLEVPAPRPAVRLVLLWQNSIGKKFLMALTGAVLFVYVVAHLLGNLQIYLGSEVIDSYARSLHERVVLLWAARVVLLASVVTHAVAGIVLYAEKRAARGPVPYASRANLQSSLPSRTMIWSGLLILGFVVFHVANLTFGSAVPGYQQLRPSVNVPAAFRVGWAAAVYVVSMVGVGFHLWHGLYSMTQSLGFRHPRYTPGLRAAAATAATLIALANISIPVAVLAGLLG